jgi:hypothetical protein
MITILLCLFLSTIYTFIGITVAICPPSICMWTIIFIIVIYPTLQLIVILSISVCMIILALEFCIMNIGQIVCPFFFSIICLILTLSINPPVLFAWIVTISPCIVIIFIFIFINYYIPLCCISVFIIILVLIFISGAFYLYLFRDTTMIRNLCATNTILEFLEFYKLLMRKP